MPEKKEEKQMRRTIALLTTMVLTLLVAASVAMAVTAVTKTCTANPTIGTKCEGTSGDDKMIGTDRTYYEPIDGVSWSENIYGYEGNDAIYPRGGADYVYGGPGNDLLYGEGGDDSIYGETGDDRIAGGPGDDRLLGASCGACGADDGNDTVYFYSSTAAITASLATTVATGEGSDRMWDFENLVGSKYNDTLTGDSGANHLRGYEGKDSYFGGLGNDTITANDGFADGIISCGPGSDKVGYDKSLDVPGVDCELKQPF
jgi:Ca2+-binding RTX toxin-like protein